MEVHHRLGGGLVVAEARATRARLGRTQALGGRSGGAQGERPPFSGQLGWRCAPYGVQVKWHPVPRSSFDWRKGARFFPVLFCLLGSTTSASPQGIRASSLFIGVSLLQARGR